MTAWQTIGVAKFRPGAVSLSIRGVAECCLCDWTTTVSTMTTEDDEIERHLRERHADVVAEREVEKAPDTSEEIDYYIVLKDQT